MTLKSLLTYAVEHGASDLHITADEAPRVRIDGELQLIPNSKVIEATAMNALFSSCLDDDLKSRLHMELDVDFGFSLENIGRFRANVFHTHNGLAGAFRVIPTEIPTLAALQLPEVIKTFTTLKHGLVLVTGPTGSGK